jgi:hypothetical protein
MWAFTSLEDLVGVNALGIGTVQLSSVLAKLIHLGEEGAYL